MNTQDVSVTLLSLTPGGRAEGSSKATDKKVAKPKAEPIDVLAERTAIRAIVQQAVTEDRLLTPEQMVVILVRQAKILNVGEGRPTDRGCHWLWSGGRAAFAAAFPGLDDRAITDAMQRDGTLEVRPWKGGPKFYLAGEAPAERKKVGGALLATIGDMLANPAPSVRRGAETHTVPQERRKRQTGRTIYTTRPKMQLSDMEIK